MSSFLQEDFALFRIILSVEEEISMLKIEESRRVYERSARLILLLALRDVCPGVKVRIERIYDCGWCEPDGFDGTQH